MEGCPPSQKLKVCGSKSSRSWWLRCSPVVAVSIKSSRAPKGEERGFGPLKLDQRLRNRQRCQSARAGYRERRQRRCQASITTAPERRVQVCVKVLIPDIRRETNKGAGALAVVVLPRRACGRAGKRCFRCFRMGDLRWDWALPGDGAAWLRCADEWIDCFASVSIMCARASLFLPLPSACQNGGSWHDRRLDRWERTGRLLRSWCLRWPILPGLARVVTCGAPWIGRCRCPSWIPRWLQSATGTGLRQAGASFGFWLRARTDRTRKSTLR